MKEYILSSKRAKQICGGKVKTVKGCLLKGDNLKGHEGSFQSTSDVLYLNLGDGYMVVFTLWKFTEPYTYNVCMHFSVYITQKFTLKNIIYKSDKNDDSLEINLIKELCKIFMEKTWQYKFHREEQKAKKKKKKKLACSKGKDLYH